MVCGERALRSGSLRSRSDKFSKEMRQGVGIGIGIMRDTPMVLLDEPTSRLDSGGAAGFVEILKQLRDEGKATLDFTDGHKALRMFSGKICVLCGQMDYANEEGSLPISWHSRFSLVRVRSY